MIRRFILLLLIFLFFFVFSQSSAVFAEIVNFRPENDDSSCTAVSLNETISVKVNGSTGSDCDFNIDVVGGGEWVNTGDYFDSPPYAWGSDTFYSEGKREKRMISYTCSQPTYSLDTSALPTYISVTGEEDIPGSGTITPNGKRYFLSVDGSAQTGTSFTAAFSYTTSCDMKSENGKMISVEKGNSDCNGKKPITVNPRLRTTAFPITIGASCNPTPTATPSPTPTKIPDACGVTCTRDSDCQSNIYSSSNQCTACVGGSCKVPPACNSSCVRDSDCNGGPALRDGCLVCVNNACQVPPTPTPVPACNIACVRDADCQGARDFCTACVNNTCQLPPTPTPTASPTPTPTPFNAAACKCDGVESTDLFSGQTATITSFGKVEGADTTKAIIKDQSFFLGEGDEIISRIIERSGPISSVVVPSTPDKVRFQSKWTFTLPQLKSGATYRIWSQINCQPKLQAINYSPAAKAVLATSTSQPKSFLQRLIDFLNGLFGGGESAEPAATTTITPSITPFASGDTSENNISANDAPTPTIRKQLQLEPIYPVEVYQKTCSFIKFRARQFSQ